MDPDSLLYAAHVAKTFAAVALTVEPMYPTYTDGDFQEHFVPGPGTRQVREVAVELQQALRQLLRSKATKLCAVNIDVVTEDFGWLR